MLKYIISLLLVFPFLASNAQVEHSSKALGVSIGAENYRQSRSFALQNVNFGSSVFVNSNTSFFAPKFRDGYARRLTIALDRQVFNEKDHYHAWSIFGSRGTWDRMQVIDIQDSLGLTIDQERERVGTATEFTVGLRYTYGLALTHKANLNFLIGFRGELANSFMNSPTDVANAFDFTLNLSFLRTYILPEVQYVFPKSPLKVSLKFALPIISVGIDVSRSANPSLTAQQQRISGVYFDNFSWINANVLELGIAYFLKS